MNRDPTRHRAPRTDGTIVERAYGTIVKRAYGTIVKRAYGTIITGACQNAALPS